jgi:NADPH:quinone reductase-like Zn-dependent oxidoreductase
MSEDDALDLAQKCPARMGIVVEPAEIAKLFSENMEWADVLKRQLDGLKNLGADRVVALDDTAAFADLEAVDAVANTVRGKTAEDLMAKVKPGGTFASVTGAPANAAKYPQVRTVAFVSKQDTKNLEHMDEAARAGKLTIPIGSRLPLRDAAVHRLPASHERSWLLNPDRTELIVTR